MFDAYSDILSIDDVMTALMVGRGRVYQMLNNQELEEELLFIICVLSAERKKN